MSRTIAALAVGIVIGSAGIAGAQLTVGQTITGVLPTVEANSAAILAAIKALPTTGSGGTVGAQVTETNSAAILSAIKTPPPLGISAGWTPTYKAGLKAIPAVIKPSAGWLGKVQCDNINSAEMFLEIFDIAAPIVGTTSPTDFVPLPPNAAAGWVMAVQGVQYKNAIVVAAVTAIGGAASPANGINCSFAWN